MAWLLYALASGFFIGLASFFRKMATKTTSPLDGFLVEGLVYGALTFLFFLFQHSKSTVIAHPWYPALSALALFVGAFFLYKALSIGNLSVTNILYLAVSLIAVLFISFLVLQETISVRQIIGILLGIGAIFLLKG